MQIAARTVFNPVSVITCLSFVRSRFVLPGQLVFHEANGIQGRPGNRGVIVKYLGILPACFVGVRFAPCRLVEKAGNARLVRVSS